jgi:hypothetical protein
MKKSFFTLLFAAACFSASAQSSAVATAAKQPETAAAGSAYTDQLGAIVNELMRTGDPAQLTSIAAKLERAGAAASTDWLPRYYRAYALLINVFQSKEDADVRDKTLDQAEAALAQARKLRGDESELLALQAYIYQARLNVSPMMRAMKYSALVRETVAQAKKLNPDNPRAYLIEANNVYYTPSMFGGGADAARPIYEAAKAKFAVAKPTMHWLPTGASARCWAA